MKRNKMSLANITERLSRAEMKKILAGDADFPGCREQDFVPPFLKLCNTNNTCTFKDGKKGYCAGGSPGSGKCYCVNAEPTP